MGDINYLKMLREKVLSDCRPDKSFWTCHGSIVRNIYELASTIESMNNWTFQFHVNDDRQKNDFAKWIEDVLEDGELAHRLKRVRNRNEYSSIIRARIRELEAAR